MLGTHNLLSAQLWANKLRDCFACSGMDLRCRDGQQRLLFPLPAAYIADLQEAFYVFGILPFPAERSDITTLVKKCDMGNPDVQAEKRTEVLVAEVIPSLKHCLIIST